MATVVLCLRDEAVGMEWWNVDVLGPFDSDGEAEEVAAVLRRRGEVAQVKRAMPAWAE